MESLRYFTITTRLGIKTTDLFPSDWTNSEVKNEINWGMTDNPDYGNFDINITGEKKEKRQGYSLESLSAFEHANKTMKEKERYPVRGDW